MMKKPEHGKKYLDSVSDEIEHCAKCGACRSVCPVFAVHGLEKKAARGKIAVCQAVADGTLPLTENLHPIVDDCLLCLTCVENCSRDVQTHKIIRSAREALFRLREASRAKRADLSAANLPAGIPETGGLAYYFLNGAGSPPPALAETPFMDRKGGILDARNAADTVFFFTGCFINHVYPGIGDALAAVLNAVGVTVRVPKSQVCCGSPMAAAGDRESARFLAKENIEALGGRHPVIAACASGGRMLRYDYPELFQEGDPWREKADALAARTVDISEYLVEKVGVDVIASKIKRRFPHAITYHDPCQLNRGQKIRTAPRALLKAACGDNFIESRQSDRCCGAGAIYGIFHPETAEKIQSHKIRDIIRSGARAVATGCPACIRQLSGGLRQKDADIHVFHTIQIIARAMGLSENHAFQESKPRSI